MDKGNLVVHVTSPTTFAVVAWDCAAGGAFSVRNDEREMVVESITSQNCPGTCLSGSYPDFVCVCANEPYYPIHRKWDLQADSDGGIVINEHHGGGGGSVVNPLLDCESAGVRRTSSRGTTTSTRQRRGAI